MESLIQDFRYAFRSLLKSSGFSTVVVLALAVGIAATTVIFSVVDHVVLRPLDYPDAAQLVAIREGIKEMSGVDLGVNASHYLEWRRDCRSCQALAAGRSAEFTLTGVGDAEKLSAARISTSMLQMLGARAQVGGIFTADLDRDQGEHTVILSDALWRSRFGADPAIVGRSITLDGMPWVVTGMLSADYHPPSSQESGWTLPASPDVYLPLALTAREATTVGEYNYSVVARLAPGRGIEDLQAELDAIETRLSEADQYRMNFRARVTPLREQIVGSSARALGLLFGAVGVVLGIVCLNLGSLVLARNVARRRESAVRVALGAGQARLIRQTFAETVLLSLTGGGIGILLANWGLGTVLRLAPALPRAREITLDARVIAGAFLLSLMTGVMFGAVPALRAGRSDPGDALRGTGRAITGDRRARRNRGLLIGSQVALTALLLISAGLLAASFARVLRVDKGFAGGPLFALDISLPANVYATREQRRAFYEEALPRLAGLPGVRRSAISTRLPLEGEIQVDFLSFQNDSRPVAQRPTANIIYVNPDYFSTMGIPLREGRAFSEADRERNVVLLSERAARTLWPGESPVGKWVEPGGNDPLAEVIGVTADIHTGSLEREGSLIAYLPYWKNPPATATLLVRTRADAAEVAGTMRAALRALAPGVPVRKERTLAAVVSASLAPRRFQLFLLGVFALTALAAASIGIYGIISQATARRTGEIGIRLAMGASPLAVARMILTEGLRPVGIGLLVGVVASMLTGRFFASLLFEVRAGDPIVLLAVGAVLSIVAMLACWLPARRAMRLDPAIALRSE